MRLHDIDECRASSCPTGVRLYHTVGGDVGLVNGDDPFAYQLAQAVGEHLAETF